VSQAGFPSEASFSELKPYTEENDWGRNSPMNLRNTFVANDRGDIVSDVKQHYRIPKDRVGNQKHFEYYTWIS
jgi:hypothetical protein